MDDKFRYKIVIDNVDTQLKSVTKTVNTYKVDSH